MLARVLKSIVAAGTHMGWEKKKEKINKKGTLFYVENEIMSTRDDLSRKTLFNPLRNYFFFSFMLVI